MKGTVRIWILISIVVLSLISIFGLPPQFLEKGIEVSYVNQDSQIFQDGLRDGMIIRSINDQEVNNMVEYRTAIQFFATLEPNQTTKLTVQTNELEIINIYNSSIIEDIVVKEISTTKIETGLDLSGGSRIFVQAEVDLTESELNDLIAITEERLNIYGLSDIKIYKIQALSGEDMMGIEIAGSSPAELEQLITEQGHFIAKIANQTVFVGGKDDITYVGRTGTDALITECSEHAAGYYCNFNFAIYLSEKAAHRHADITDSLAINGSYLSEKLDFYIDGEKTSSLNIGASLKGQVATQISISGAGEGLTRDEAIEMAKSEMNRLQTILITGSLPYKLEIVKMDKISPNLSDGFAKQLLVAGFLALIAVSLLIFVYYRQVKMSIIMMSMSISEVIIILGIAALINWNLDLPSIAGIIAAIGTGIDDQIIILDEARKKHESIKQRIKKALFIIITAFATTFVAMTPLTGFLGFMGIGATSAGILKGFAITTLIGITAGVLITRPAFADIAKRLED
jgi:preprotein translocase subunit SecD